ncbi:MAG: hypothetical protein COU08_04020 [Candidatus Harrisonbacteria bacterium CG10_big_fil_rev_8_21_14_0_10_42_17]|uniref:Uncharacterized protein n=1 Tax=Candidatus Harrisonbacteria bacterium CG10_big_fil_rev_8_21_14_0_10_42_17 TaxID=1974584 RepID=A0A2M6WH76_9BACT|nr:MAG: hypothetical protein COU08_04020 [Candidatus Harrisonbacteria bacterium CG10_big_fil_rev_8_21_14_0_10_42_17]
MNHFIGHTLWEHVCTTSLWLCSGLWERGGFHEGLVYIPDHSQRIHEIDLFEGFTPNGHTYHRVEDPGHNLGWSGYDLSRSSRFLWKSERTEATLEARRLPDNFWSLTFCGAPCISPGADESSFVRIFIAGILSCEFIIQSLDNLPAIRRALDTNKYTDRGKARSILCFLEQSLQNRLALRA